MSSGPPRRPAGPPPRPVDGMQGVGQMSLDAVRRPAGPPPAMAPIAILKPPPAQPPSDIVGESQRPSIQNVRTIEPPKLLAPFIMPPPRGLPPRNPPPRATSTVPGNTGDMNENLTPSKRSDEYMLPGMMSMRVAPPKNIMSGQGRWSKKPGAIPMFHNRDANENNDPVAESKQTKRVSDATTEEVGALGDPFQIGRLNTSKPAPPARNPDGIPESKAAPPADDPLVDTKPPAPIRPAPNCNRAPPRLEPEQEAAMKKRAPLPPSEEAPFKRAVQMDSASEVKPFRAESFDMENSDDENELKIENMDEAKKPNWTTEEKAEEFQLQPRPIVELAINSDINPDAVTEMEMFISTPSHQSKVRDAFEAKKEEDVTSRVALGVDNAIKKISGALNMNFKSGRLSVRLIEGSGFIKEGSRTSIDPFVTLRVGSSDKFETKKSDILRRVSENPKFNNEVISFDLFNPVEYIIQDDIQLVVEVWSSGTFEDILFGTFNMSLLQILTTPFLTFNEGFLLQAPTAASEKVKLTVDIIFEEARAGMFVVTLYEARGLRNVDPLGHQRPYLNLTLGKANSKRSKSVENNPTEPYFAEEEICLWMDKDTWTQDLQMDLLDEDIGAGKPIGKISKCLLPYMNYSLPLKDAAVETLSVGDRGELVVKIKFLPSGVLQLKCNLARNLEFPETYVSPSGADKIDPYVVFKMSSLAQTLSKRTPAEKDGGMNPTWNYDISFDVVDQYSIDVEIYHQNIVGSDVLLGTGQLSLLPVFQKGEVDTWVTLKQKKSNGGIAERGDLNLKLVFKGIPGLAYPQHRPDIDAFDDKARKGVALSMTAIQDSIMTSATSKYGDYKPEFSDAEIRAAFNFIDLDHNNFVGAGEIRHILVCMGELITDEEIDMMISMVDLDGDGQVSYSEFKFIVCYPNPGEADLIKEMAELKQQELQARNQELSLLLKSKGQSDVAIDLATHQRQKEILARESKRKALASFVDDNDTDFEDIQIAFTKYSAIANQKMLNGMITFDLFCELLKVEPISEYKHLFGLFDDEQLGKINVKDLLLSMLNFIQVDKEARVKFAFEMYDEQRTNFITVTEVELILKGNHMVNLVSVIKKAETIMRQATTNAQGLITLNEFLNISKKFPNILFPVLQEANKELKKPMVPLLSLA